RWTTLLYGRLENAAAHIVLPALVVVMTLTAPDFQRPGRQRVCQLAHACLDLTEPSRRDPTRPVVVGQAPGRGCHALQAAPLEPIAAHPHGRKLAGHRQTLWRNGCCRPGPEKLLGQLPACFPEVPATQQPALALIEQADRRH